MSQAVTIRTLSKNCARVLEPQQPKKIKLRVLNVHFLVRHYPERHTQSQLELGVSSTHFEFGGPGYQRNAHLLILDRRQYNCPN